MLLYTTVLQQAGIRNTTVVTLQFLTTRLHAIHLTFHAFAISPDVLEDFQYHYISKMYLETIFVNKYRMQ